MLIAVLLSASACHTITRQEVMSDVDAAARVGTPIAVASKELGQIGFRCGENYDVNSVPGDVLCDRHGGAGYILTGCIQRVFIDLDRHKRIHRIHDPSVSCAGL